MLPVKKKKAGRELGNAAAAGEIAGVSWETYQWYIRTGRPAGNPAPAHVEIDNDTGQRMYPLKDVRAWQAKRPGRGNWGGIGARARQPEPTDPPAVDQDVKVVEEIEAAGHDQVEPDGMDVFRPDTDDAGVPVEPEQIAPGPLVEPAPR